MKAIVHIGGEKTGTTTIQEFASRNRERLLQHGMLYPVSLGTPNQVKLTAYALADDKMDDIRVDLGLTDHEALRIFRQAIKSELKREIDTSPGITTLLMSNEHLQSRLVSVKEVGRLREFVSEFADDIKIIVYLRRQDRVAVSYYSTKLKAGFQGGNDVFPKWGPGRRLPLYYDYDVMLRRYEEVFGIGSIDVRIFEADRFVNGDLLDDFGASCGISDEWDLLSVPRRNESLSEVGIQFFKRFNEAVPRFIDRRPNPRWDDAIIRTMMKRFHGSGPATEKADAEAFYRKFSESNRAVGLRYFPDRGGVLFEESFTTYDGAETIAPSPEVLMDVAVHLWQERTSEISDLKLENALLRCAAAVKSPSDSQWPDVPAIQPDTSNVSRNVMRAIGALLYNGEYRRVEDLSRGVLEKSNGRAVLALVLGLSLLLQGKSAEFEAHLDVHSNNRKLANSLAALRRTNLDNVDRAVWLGVLKSGDAIHASMYSKCLAWLVGENY